MWQLTQSTLFALSPQPLYGWRRILLRLFGAKIGRKVLIRPTARITYPWKVDIGDYSWVGDSVELYSLDHISIGHHAVVSQRSYLCTGSHDHHDIAFSYKTAPIIVEDEVWIASDVFVGLGVTIGRGAVIGARSTVLKNVDEANIVLGYPAKARGKRKPQSEGILRLTQFEGARDAVSARTPDTLLGNGEQHPGGGDHGQRSGPS